MQIRVLSVAVVRRWPPVTRRARRGRPLSRRAQEELVEDSGHTRRCEHSKLTRLHILHA